MLDLSKVARQGNLARVDGLPRQDGLRKTHSGHELARLIKGQGVVVLVLAVKDQAEGADGLHR